MSDNANTDTKRTQVLPPCRVTSTERDIIRRKAQKASLSLSEYLRRSALTSAITIRHSPVDAQAVRQLSAIGSNLNQLVKALHIHNSYDRTRLDEILCGIDAIIMEIVHDT